MYATKYNNLVFIFFYSGNVIYGSVLELIYQKYYFFKCNVDQMYLTSVYTVSNSATSYSPTDGAQIISNNSLLSTSDFFVVWVKYPVPNNTDSMIHIT